MKFWWPWRQRSAFDWGQAVGRFNDALAEIGLHVMDHQIVEDWEEIVAEISYALELWWEWEHAIDAFDMATTESAMAVDQEEGRLWDEFWDYTTTHLQRWWD